MRTLLKRTPAGLFPVLLLALGLWWLNFTLVNTFRPASLVSGLLLFALVLFLLLFNARKKLPFVPLVRATVWMHLHSWAGLLTVVVYFLHAGFKLPQGPLEAILAALFAVVTVSGIAGLVMSRIFPARLTLHGESLIFERIPALRTAVRNEVEELVLGSMARTQSSTVADFYDQKLRSYFARPVNLWLHLLGQKRPLHRLTSEIRALDRYLNAEERQVMSQIEEMVYVKDNLDFQWALQGALKLWLFIHVPLSYALILAATVHGLLAWRFS